jgi:hypothetical protein
MISLNFNFGEIMEGTRRYGELPVFFVKEEKKVEIEKSNDLAEEAINQTGQLYESIEQPEVSTSSQKKLENDYYPNPVPKYLKMSDYYHLRVRVEKKG